MSASEAPITHIATATADDVLVRGRSLCHDLLGRLTFTEMLFFEVLGHEPTPAQTAMVDACLVALMEHGLTPSAIAARMTWSSAPEALQGAVAAGLLGVGGVFAGTMEGSARLLARIAAAKDPPAEAEEAVREHREAGEPVPGFGHPVHRPEDPRAVRLLAIAREQAVAGPHVRALEALSAAVDRALGRHLPVNATGAIAATLSDCGVPVDIVRGFALVSRCAGLVGHVHEEQRSPALRAMWAASESAVRYEDPEASDE